MVVIEREITPLLLRRFEQYPIVTVTGPRQSGKTTLCRATFPDLPYVNLEAHHVREAAVADPVRFLAQFPDGAVLDEIQNAPELPSYLQVLVDEDRRNGLFVLTGSEQFGLTNTLSQSLAGRTALLRLWPFSLAELRRVGAGGDVDQVLYSGCFPRVHSEGLDPTSATADYFSTYVERDARRIGNISNHAAFRRFLGLCAGRVGQLVNMSNLAGDTGVAHTTVAGWLNVLEASDIIFRLQPHFANIRKRLTKSPKLYFVDVGLAGYLIGIRGPEQLRTHPLRGALFENAAVVEAVKHSHNHARYAELSFFRTADGLECDLLYPTPAGLAAVEIKSASTPVGGWFDGLRRVRRTVPGVATAAIVYGGSELQARGDATAVPLGSFGALLADLDTLSPAPAPGASVIGWSDDIRIAWDPEEPAIPPERRQVLSEAEDPAPSDRTH